MNIIKLQDQLKGLPDQTLAGYVQNPTGEVPTYLALSELQRRKTMREKYQQEQAPTTTVAEDLVAPPPQEAQGLASIAPDQMPPEMMAQAPQMPQAPVQMAEGGLAELDVGDMYDEQNFASGGIVAFDNGGDVQRFVEGGTSRIEDWYTNLRTKNLEKQKENKLINELLTEKYRIESDIFSALTPEQKAAQNNALTQIDAMLAEAKAKKEGANKNATDVKPQADMTGKPPAQEGKGGYTYLPGESATKSPSDTYFDTLNQFMPKTSAATGIKSERLTYDPTLLTKGLEDPEAAFTKGTERYTTFMGDNKAIKDQETRLAARQTALKDRESKDLGLSLLTGGLDILGGTSPFAAVNLSRGKSGVEQYIKSMDRRQELSEKIDDARFALDQAVRAEKAAAFKYGDDDRKTADAHKRTTDIQQKLYKLETDKFNITSGQKDKEMGLQAQLVDIKRADLAKDIAFGNRQLQMYEDRIKAMDQNTQAKYAGIKAKAAIEANKLIYNNQVPQIRALVKEFESKGLRTYGNPEFENRFNTIKNALIASYIGPEMEEDLFANVPNAKDFITKAQAAQ